MKKLRNHRSRRFKQKPNEGGSPRSSREVLSLQENGTSSKPRKERRGESVQRQTRVPPRQRPARSAEALGKSVGHLERENIEAKKEFCMKMKFAKSKLGSMPPTKDTYLAHGETITPRPITLKRYHIRQPPSCCLCHSEPLP